MTEICTNTDVFNFMNTGESERNSNAEMIDGLIERVQYGIEQYIGRKLSAESKTIKVHDGFNGVINGNMCFLNGVYYDIAKITSLTDNGTVLTENTDFVVTGPNLIQRIDENWTNESLGLVIEGVFGLVYNNGTDETPEWIAYPDIKQIVIEAVAMKSGLWAKNIEDGEGNEYTVVRQNLPKSTMKQLEAYKQPVL